MKKRLWYLFAGTSGADNRVHIIRRLMNRPHNANELSEDLDLDYNTIRHHLRTLGDYGVVESGDSEYGQLYFLTDQFKNHMEEFERITEEITEGSQTNEKPRQR